MWSWEHRKIHNHGSARALESFWIAFRYPWCIACDSDSLDLQFGFKEGNPQRQSSFTSKPPTPFFPKATPAGSPPRAAEFLPACQQATYPAMATKPTALYVGFISWSFKTKNNQNQALRETHVTDTGAARASHTSIKHRVSHTCIHGKGPLL